MLGPRSRFRKDEMESRLVSRLFGCRNNSSSAFRAVRRYCLDFFFFLLTVDLARPRRSDLAVNADINSAIPPICSAVQTLLNMKNDMNRVIAFRAVLVIDMANAPKFLVIAAEQDDPKNPMEENVNMTSNFPDTDQERSSIGIPAMTSSYVPGVINQTSPSRKSPFKAAAAVMATNAIEYNRKMNCEQASQKLEVKKHKHRDSDRRTHLILPYSKIHHDTFT